MFTLINTNDLTVVATSHKISHLEQYIKQAGDDPRSTMVKDHYTYSHDKYRIYHIPDSTSATIIALTLLEDYPRAFISHHPTERDAELYAMNEFGDDMFKYLFPISARCDMTSAFMAGNL